MQNKQYMRAVRLKDCAELREQAVLDEVYDTLQEHYVEADKSDVADGKVVQNAADMGECTEVEVHTAMCIGDMHSVHARWYTGKAIMLRGADGSMWLDMEQHDEVFC